MNITPEQVTALRQMWIETFGEPDENDEDDLRLLVDQLNDQPEDVFVFDGWGEKTQELIRAFLVSIDPNVQIVFME